MANPNRVRSVETVVRRRSSKHVPSVELLELSELFELPEPFELQEDVRNIINTNMNAGNATADPDHMRSVEFGRIKLTKFNLIMWKYNTHLYFQNESRGSLIEKSIDQLRNCCICLISREIVRIKPVIGRASNYKARYSDSVGGLSVKANDDRRVIVIYPCLPRMSGIVRFLQKLRLCEPCDGLGHIGDEGFADVLGAMVQKFTVTADSRAATLVGIAGHQNGYEARGREQVDVVELMQLPQPLFETKWCVRSLR